MEQRQGARALVGLVEWRSSALAGEDGSQFPPELLQRFARRCPGAARQGGAWRAGRIVILERSAHAAMVAAAAASAPREACGLLTGKGNHVTAVFAARNVAPDPLRRFEIDPVALIAAHRVAREGGPQVLGYFHSHPNGLARPSAVDVASAAGGGLVWAIVANDGITLWKDARSGFEPLSYALVES